MDEKYILAYIAVTLWNTSPVHEQTTGWGVEHDKRLQYSGAILATGRQRSSYCKLPVLMVL